MSRGEYRIFSLAEWLDKFPAIKFPNICQQGSPRLRGFASRKLSIAIKVITLMQLDGGRTGSRMFIETIAGTTIHTIEDTSNEEDPHVYNHISNPSYNQLHKYMAI